MDEPSLAPPSYTLQGQFDVLEWYPIYQSCQRFFLNHAQYEPACQAVCTFINIRLPFQWPTNPVYSFPTPSSPSSNPPSSSSGAAGPALTNPPSIYSPISYSRQSTSSMLNSPGSINAGLPPPPIFFSVIPYIRRLVVTGFDREGVLHGLFGDDWRKGVMVLVECERRNYLFAAKQGGWGSCKTQYDVGSGQAAGAADETVPFMVPLCRPSAEELDAADRNWSEWLAMEDWMVGPRAPDSASVETERVEGERGRERGMEMEGTEEGGVR